MLTLMLTPFSFPVNRYYRWNTQLRLIIHLRSGDKRSIANTYS